MCPPRSGAVPAPAENAAARPRHPHDVDVPLGRLQKVRHVVQPEAKLASASRSVLRKVGRKCMRLSWCLALDRPWALCHCVEHCNASNLGGITPWRTLFFTPARNWHDGFLLSCVAFLRFAVETMPTILEALGAAFKHERGCSQIFQCSANRLEHGALVFRLPPRNHSAA